MRLWTKVIALAQKLVTASHNEVLQIACQKIVEWMPQLSPLLRTVVHEGVVIDFKLHIVPSSWVASHQTAGGGSHA